MDQSDTMPIRVVFLKEYIFYLSNSNETEILDENTVNNGSSSIQTICTDSISKISKNEKLKQSKKNASISRSTNDLSISHIPIISKHTASSSIPIVTKNFLDKSKSKSISSLKKATKNDAEIQQKKDATKAQIRQSKKDAKKRSSTSSERKSSIKIEKNSSISDSAVKKSSNSEEDLNKIQNSRTPSNIGKTFKRTIINKKLPVRLNLKNKQTTTNQQANNKLESNLEANEKQAVDDLNNKLDKPGPTQPNTSQKREIVLYKDDNLGFGFIAGSEKPLVVRFVTPGLNFEYFLKK